MIPGQKLPGGSPDNFIIPGVTKEVAFIIDRSGSMADRLDQVINGFNEYVDTLRAERNPNIRLSVTFFDTRCENRHVSVPLESIPQLTRYNYRPDGMTALLDAVGKTVNALDGRSYGRTYGVPHYLIIIMTDGKENASREYNTDSIRRLIESRQERGNWTFVFLGADQDAWGQAKNLGFYSGNVMNYNSNETYGTMRRLARCTTLNTRSSVASTKSFFNDAGVDNITPPETLTSTGESKLTGS